MTFNLGDLFSIAAKTVPDRTAVIYGNLRFTYRELDERSDRLAAALARRGLKRGMRVGLLLHSSSAHLEFMMAVWKIGATSFNLNYRYESEELWYVVDDAQAFAVITEPDLAAMLSSIRPRLPQLELVVLADHAAPLAPQPGQVSYSAMVSEAVDGTDITTGRSDDDSLLLYTGGTTGRPKGVQWTHKNLFFAALGAGALFRPGDPVKTSDEMSERVATAPHIVALGLSPLMHGAAMWGSLSAILYGQTYVMVNSRSLNAELTWDTVARERVNSLSLTGDAMAMPLLDALTNYPDRWDTSSLMAISWGGAPLGATVQARFRERFPHAFMIDGLGSSEGGALSRGMPSKGEGILTLAPIDYLGVIVDGKRFAEPGETGILARCGHLPTGYWRDPEKTAATFPTVGGRRWVLTGDQARLEADGSMTFFGRASTSINTGGEKVFAEEVEAMIRSHPQVLDALVVGIPDERWGEQVVAVVACRPGAVLTLSELLEFGTGRLARYKLPRKLVIAPAIKRSPANKADYRWAKAVAVGT